MTIIRVNNMGMKYQLTELPNAAYGHRTSILLIGTGKKIIVDSTIEAVIARWYRWQMKGEFIQDAFSNLSADQREFLLTGITPEEWSKIFPEDEEN